MYWHKEASQLIGKKPKCYGIKKFKKKKKKRWSFKIPSSGIKKTTSHIYKAIEF